MKYTDELGIGRFLSSLLAVTAFAFVWFAFQQGVCAQIYPCYQCPLLTTLHLPVACHLSRKHFQQLNVCSGRNICRNISVLFRQVIYLRRALSIQLRFFVFVRHEKRWRTGESALKKQLKPTCQGLLYTTVLREGSSLCQCQCQCQ